MVRGWMVQEAFHEILIYMDPTTANPNANFMTGTDPNLVNSLYAPGATQTATTGQTPTPTPTTPTAPPTTPQTPSTPTAPSTNLEPGAQGQDVEALQSYLVQMGYLNPSQVGSGAGTYGPQTTAAVAKLQSDLGINAGNAAGDYGPQTQTALNQKYQGVFQSVKNTQAPNTASEANTQIQAASQPSTDPVFGALTSSLAPIMDSLNQVLSNINNPALTAVSLQQEYNTLATQSNLPALNSQLLNMQNIMNGTTDDIRNEISSAGGTATESQVQAMSSARNTVILKQYNALSSQYTAAQQNIQTQLQYATTDQATQLQRAQATAGVQESMASIESQALSMGVTMQQNAVSAVQYNVSQTGYQGLAASAQGNPQILSYYEQLLNLAPGTLSNPNSLAALDSYKQQQLAISQENAQNAGNRTIIYGEAQGYPLGGTTSTGTVTANGTTAPVTIDPNSLVRPSFVAANVPLSISSADMQSMIAGAPQGKITSGGTAGTNAYGNNITVNGVGNYVAQPDGSYILGSALPAAPTSDVNSIVNAVNSPGTQVPQMNYTDIKAVEAAAPASSLSPTSTAFSKETLAVKRLLQYQVTSPVYTTVSQAPLPFARIQAAKNGNNSISDTELLDSYITLAKGQGQITDAMITAITSASSMSDKLNIIKQKVVGAGALISQDQRSSLLSLSGSVFDQYSQQYQTLYTQGINLLAQNHIAPSFWGTLPDFTQMFSGADLSSSQLENPGI